MTEEQIEFILKERFKLIWSRIIEIINNIPKEHLQCAKEIGEQFYVLGGFKGIELCKKQDVYTDRNDTGIEYLQDNTDDSPSS